MCLPGLGSVYCYRLMSIKYHKLFFVSIVHAISWRAKTRLLATVAVAGADDIHCSFQTDTFLFYLKLAAVHFFGQDSVMPIAIKWCE